MKIAGKLVAIMIVITTSLSAQHNNGKPLSKVEDGIYRSFKDFENYHFFDSVNVSNHKNMMKENDFDQIVLKEGRHKRKYTEGEIYGYALNGKEYRYFDSGKPFNPYGYFEIVEINGLVIYRQTENSSSPDVEYDYFYSKDLTSPIKLLSKHNLKYELNNKEFIVALFSLKNINERKNGEFVVTRLFNKYKNNLCDL